MSLSKPATHNSLQTVTIDKNSPNTISVIMTQQTNSAVQDQKTTAQEKPHHLLSYNEQIRRNLQISEVQNPAYICQQIPIQYCNYLKDQNGQKECLTFWKQCCGTQAK